MTICALVETAGSACDGRAKSAVPRADKPPTISLRRFVVRSISDGLSLLIALPFQRIKRRFRDCAHMHCACVARARRKCSVLKPAGVLRSANLCSLCDRNVALEKNIFKLAEMLRKDPEKSAQHQLTRRLGLHNVAPAEFQTGEMLFRRGCGRCRLPGACAFFGKAMKIKNSLRSLRNRHRDNRVVRRRGRLYIINKTVKRYKARQG